MYLNSKKTKMSWFYSHICDQIYLITRSVPRLFPSKATLSFDLSLQQLNLKKKEKLNMITIFAKNGAYEYINWHLTMNVHRRAILILFQYWKKRTFVCAPHKWDKHHLNVNVPVVVLCFNRLIIWNETLAQTNPSIYIYICLCFCLNCDRRRTNKNQSIDRFFRKL